MQAVSDILEEGKDLENFVWEMIKHTKSLLMCKINDKQEIYSEEEKKQMEETAEKTSKEELINIIYKLSELESKMKMSSQKIIIFETEIIKLCTKFETKGLEDRIINLEKKLEKGEFVVPTLKAQSSERSYQERPTPAFTPRPVPAPNQEIQATEKRTQEPKIEKTAPVTLTEGTPIKEWPNVINRLKTQGKVMLYANLINTEAITANDMTVVIRFNNGLNSFREELLKKPENMNILTKEISMLCEKPMRSKARRRK